MPNSLSIKKLNQLGKVVSGGTPSTVKPEYWGADIPWITPKDLSSHQGKYISKGERSITTEGLNRSSATLVPRGTVLFSSRAPIGYIAIASNELTTNQGFKNIVPYEHTDTQFLFYLLKNNIELIKSQANGSTFIEVSANVFKNIEVQVPDYSNQLIIGEILSSFDDKIEINNKINSNLEELAHTLYNRWFVDFEFPNEEGKPYKSSGGEMVESELGLIPKPFSVVKLSDIVNKINGYSYKGKELSESTIGLVNLKNSTRSSGFNVEGFKSLADTQNVKEKQFCDTGDVLLTCTDVTQSADYIGNPIYLYSKNDFKKLVFTMDLMKLEPKNSLISKVYLYEVTRNRKFKDFALGFTSGTTVLHLNKSVIDHFQLPLPTDDLLIKFQTIIEPIHMMISSNIDQNLNLIKTRDLLLPKLMSGEIEV